MTFDCLITKLIEDSTSKAPKGGQDEKDTDTVEITLPKDLADVLHDLLMSVVEAEEDNETAKKVGKTALKVAGKAAKGTAKLAGKSALYFADYMTDGDVSKGIDFVKSAYSEEDAEYRGRKVSLNKPTRGDVKKFKVYVKDPKTGNVKKVNFGHGGTSAKSKGEKTMKIRKSNPKARKSFRARHKCDQKKSKMSAGYWSCKKW